MQRLRVVSDKRVRAEWRMRRDDDDCFSAALDDAAELTRRIIQSGAETVVIISPHAPLSSDAFVAYHSQPLHADFANFRAPATTVEFPLDEELLAGIVNAAAGANYE